jgi:hypothetical protein
LNNNKNNKAEAKPFELEELVGNKQKLKVFNSVVLNDPRKTVYKNVNRGSRETDPSQVYFG